jgi:hypothetical protein
MSYKVLIAPLLQRDQAFGSQPILPETGFQRRHIQWQ